MILYETKCRRRHHRQSHHCCHGAQRLPKPIVVVATLNQARQQWLGEISDERLVIVAVVEGEGVLSKFWHSLQKLLEKTERLR